MEADKRQFAVVAPDAGFGDEGVGVQVYFGNDFLPFSLPGVTVNNAHDTDVSKLLLLVKFPCGLCAYLCSPFFLFVLSPFPCFFHLS